MPAFGPAGVYTFVLDIEAGAKVGLRFDSDVLKAHKGSENRLKLRAAPKLTFDFQALLRDSEARIVFGALAENAAAAPVFLLGLSYEELAVSADSSGTTVPVRTTANSDWIVAGQRIVLVSVAGMKFESWIVSFTGTSITLNDAPGALGKAGARIMPAVAINIQPQQGFAAYPVGVNQWQLRAEAQTAAYAGSTTMGIGATVNTFDGLPLFDKGIGIDGTNTVSVESLAELVDLGGAVSAVSAAAVNDYGRQLRMESDLFANWQWFKKFAQTVAGPQKAFLLPTNRPDLVKTAQAATTLTVEAAAKYVTGWFPSLAHRRLALTKTDGSVQYVTVTVAGDNGDGTHTLTLGQTITGTVSKVSFLEQCRFAQDDLDITWQDATFSVDTKARVVQSATTSAGVTWYDNEKSVQSSAPVELFTFTTPSATYRFTSYDQDITVGGNTYTSATSARSSLVSGSASDANGDFTVDVLATHATAVEYAVNEPREMQCAVSRYQPSSNIALSIGGGYVVSMTFHGRFATFRVSSTHDAFSTEIPTVSVGRICPHVLYDARCTIARASFEVSTTIATISTNRKQITVASIGGMANQWAQYGEVVATVLTQRRTITGQVGTTIDLMHKLPPNISIGAAVKVYAGCDHHVATCRDKFANVKNFGGMPSLPGKNPFYVDIKVAGG